MSVVSPTWLSLSGEANYIRSTYIDGFLDVSSSRGVLLRSDVSFGSRLIMSTNNFTGTVSPNSTAATSSTWVNNGVTWTSSVSSTYTSEAGFTSEKLFDSNVNTSWHNTGSGYTSGVANSTFSTSINSGGTVSSANGDWMQIQSSVPVIMKDFTLNLRSGLPGRMPKTFYLVGSNNGSTWTTIMYGTTTSTTGTLSGLVPVSTLTSSGSGTIANFYGSTSLSYTTYGNVTTPFTYFRFITTHLTSTGENLLNISEWNINFTPATQAITLAPSTTAYGQLDLTGGLTTTGNASVSKNLYFTDNNNGVAIGLSALNALSTGDSDNAIGFEALKAVTTGFQNNALGYQALLATTGNNNVAIGGQAGRTNTTGSNNTYLGRNADADANNYSTSTALGSGATITASNQIMLGTSSETVKIPGILQVQSTARVKGFASGTIAGGSGTGTVSFGFTFANVPNVVASINSNSSTQVFNVQVHTITTTGFSYTKTFIFTTGSSGGLAGSEGFFYIAIGL